MRFNYKEDLSRKYIQKNKEEGSHSNMKRNNLQVNWPNKDNHQQGERIQTPVLVKRLGYQLTIFSTKHGTSHSPRHPTKWCLPHTGAYRAKFIDAVFSSYWWLGRPYCFQPRYYDSSSIFSCWREFFFYYWCRFRLRIPSHKSALGLLGCPASFVHAFVDEIWKTISNLEFRRLDLKTIFWIFVRRSIAALVKTDRFLFS